MHAVLDAIKAFDRIYLFRHKYPDGDCMGATKGLKQLLMDSYPEKQVLLADKATSEYLKFMGEGDDVPACDETYAGALAIVLDTATGNRIANPKYALCAKVIKIDHHIDVEPYGDIQWVEPERSSACEMIAAFYDCFRDALIMRAQAAEYLYAGMVTDSGRFRYRGVTGDTLRYAGLLLDRGVNTEMLYAQLYLKEIGSLKFRAYVYENIQATENGVAHITVNCETQRVFGLSFEDACNAISYLDSIKGCLCWLAFIESAEDACVRVRLRSRFMTVNALAARYQGGGHACASGATVYSQAEIDALIRDADALVKEYKDTHDDWL